MTRETILTLIGVVLLIATLIQWTESGEPLSGMNLEAME